jgi:hypothetical protein
MERVFAKIEELGGHVRDYVNTKITSVKIGAAAKGSKILANLFAACIAACVFLFFLVFASIAAAYALSAWIGKMYAGFLIVSGIYFLAGIIIWNGRERLLRIPIMNAMIAQLFKKDEEAEKN